MREPVPLTPWSYDGFRRPWPAVGSYPTSPRVTASPVSPASNHPPLGTGLLRPWWVAVESALEVRRSSTACTARPSRRIVTTLRARTLLGGHGHGGHRGVPGARRRGPGKRNAEPPPTPAAGAIAPASARNLRRRGGPAEALWRSRLCQGRFLSMAHKLDRAALAEFFRMQPAGREADPVFLFRALQR